MARILIVDDSDDIVSSVSLLLRQELHDVVSVGTAGDGLQLLEHQDFDVVVLDWQLPDKGGVEILSAYRKKGGMARVIMLTGRSDVADKETGFEAGADDYLTKPFEPVELKARIKSLLRRSRDLSGQSLHSGKVRLDLNTFEAFCDDQRVDLNKQELKLLEFFMRNSNRVFSEEAIITRVWSDNDEATSDALRSALKRLRKKIDPAGELIKNVRGVGYIFRAQD